MASLRTMRGLSNRENALANPVANKAVTKGAVSKGITTRSALGEVGNRTNRGQAQAVKPLKPARAGLTRQKASVDLSDSTKENVAPVRRASARLSGKKEAMEEPMEVQETLDDVEMMEVAPAFSLKEAKIEDIDADDRENPQLAVEYVNEIYAYLRQLEEAQPVLENYLEMPGLKTTIKPKMRNLLIDWLVEVHHQFSLLQETLYLTVALIDRFLQVKASAVTTKQLQLVGVTAMFIAAQYEEMYPPEIGDFVYITDRAYTAGQIRTMEIMMMAALKFEMGRPLPLHFLRRCSKAGHVDSVAHGLAKYVMELALVEYSMAHFPPSIVAAASLAVAIRVLDPEKTSLRHLWTPTLQYYTSYSIEAISEAVSAIARLLMEATKIAFSPNEETSGKKKLRAVTKKYSGKKHLKIALLPTLQDDVVRKMAEEGDM